MILTTCLSILWKSVGVHRRPLARARVLCGVCKKWNSVGDLMSMEGGRGGTRCLHNNHRPEGFDGNVSPPPPALHTVPCVQCRRNVPFGQFSQFFAVAHERGNTTKDNYGIVALR